MVEISLSGSGEGLRAETPWGYSTLMSVLQLEKLFGGLYSVGQRVPSPLTAFGQIRARIGGDFSGSYDQSNQPLFEQLPSGACRLSCYPVTHASLPAAQYPTERAITHVG